MEKNFDGVIEKINNFAGKLSGNRYLNATMSGMMATMPVMMVNAIATILKNLPIAAYTEFLAASNLNLFFDIPINICTNITALLVVLGVSYELCKSFKKDPLVACMISLVAFLILTPLNATVNDWGMIDYSLPVGWLGAQGMFTALITAFISTRAYVFLNDHKITIKMPESVPEFVSKSFSAVLPGLIILTAFAALSTAMTFTSFGSIHSLVYTLLQKPLGNMGSSIWALMILSILAQLLWFFGIHGGMVVLGSVSFVLMPMDIAQIQAYAANQPLPNITGMQFFLFYTGFVTLPLVLLGLLFGKSERNKTMSKMGLISSVFAIDEPMIFGTPLIMNFRYFFPFVFQGAISLGLAYVLTVVGILPRLPAIAVQNGIPIGMTGFVAGSWKFALFQILLVGIRMLMWFPFFKSADKAACLEEAKESAE